MNVTVERVDTFNLRNLIGYDAPEETINAHLACITDSAAIWLGRADGVEACAVGVIPFGIFSSKAYIWFIHTKLCEQHPLRLIRWSRKVMDEIRSHYPTIVGLCHCDNEYGQQWLRWLGAVFDYDPYNNHFRFKIDGNLHPPG